MKRLKRQTTWWKNVFVIHKAGTNFVCRIYKKLPQTNEKTDNSIEMSRQNFKRIILAESVPALTKRDRVKTQKRFLEIQTFTERK